MTRGSTSSPLVSVIIPAYRRPDFVRQAVASVMRQTFTDYEIIVVDDGSGDEIVMRYRLPDAVRLLRRSSNSGKAAISRNEGYHAAHGRYLAFLDMDDIWKPDLLETQVAILAAHPEVGVTFCHYTNVDESLNPLPQQMPLHRPITDALAQLISGCFLHTPSLALIRRAALVAEGLFDEQIAFAADWDLWIRLARSTQFFFDPTPRVLYRRYPQQQSVDRRRMLLANIAVLQKTMTWVAEDRPALLPLIKRQLSRWYNRYAWIQLATGEEPMVIQRSLTTALAYHPFSLHAYRLLMVLVGYSIKHGLLRNKAP